MHILHPTTILNFIRVATRLRLSTTDTTPDIVATETNDFFSGWVLKDRPSDFIVLEDRVINSFGKAPSRSSQEEVVESVPNLDDFITQTQVDDLAILAEQSAGVATSVGRTSYTLFLNRPTSKEERTQLHRAIKGSFPGLESKTIIDDATRNISTSFLVYPSGAKSIIDDSQKDARSGKGGRKSLVQRWDKSKPEYLHFTVAKTMMSTAEMIDELARRSGILSTRFEYCGSKDKRAVTMQRVSLWRGEWETMERAINGGGAGGATSNLLLIRDIAPERKPLRLGDLRGNHFIITLRRDSTSSLTTSTLTPSRDRVLSALEGIGTQPFVNNFGPQRFGAQINPEIGKSLLRGDYRSAVLLLLLAPQSEEELAVSAFDLPGFIDIVRASASISDPTTTDNSSKSDGLTKEEGDDSPRKRRALETTSFFSRLGGWWRAYADRCYELARVANEQHSSDSNVLEEMTFELDKDAMTTSSVAPLSVEMKPSTAATLVSKAKIRMWRRLMSRVRVVSALLLGGERSGGQISSKEINRLSYAQSNLVNAWLKEVSHRASSRKRSGGDCDSVDSNSIEQAQILGEANDSPVSAVVGVDFQRVLAVLPLTLRLLFVNSYQSLLWNNAVSIYDSADRRGGAAFAGDIVLVDAKKLPLSAWDVSEKNVSLVANRVKLWDGDSANNDDDISCAFFHIVTEDEEAERVFPASALIAPLPGDSTHIPSAMSSSIVSDGMEVLVNGNHRDAVFRLPGAYRHVFATAANVRYLRPQAGESLTHDSWKQVKEVGSSSDETIRGFIAGLTPEESVEKQKRPFVGEVDLLWQNGAMLRLIQDIKGTRDRDVSFGSLPSVLADRNRYHNDFSIAAIDNGKTSISCEMFEKDSDNTAISLAFSLCSSSYATTYLSWLLGRAASEI